MPVTVTVPAVVVFKVSDLAVAAGVDGETGRADLGEVDRAEDVETGAGVDGGGSSGGGLRDVDGVGDWGCR